MKILQEIPESEMIATFLKAEMTSTRFGGKVIEILEKDKKPRSIINNPNLNSKEENDYRKHVLKNHRGFSINDALFENFPSDVIWNKVLLTKEELQSAKYIKFDYWIELSGGTRLAKDGAKNVLKGKEIFKQSNENFLKAAEAVRNGAIFEKMILVAPNEKSDLVVLEGHLRLTAYCMAIEQTPDQMEVIVGFSENIRKWDLY